jgi:hypothetical protein
MKRNLLVALILLLSGLPLVFAVSFEPFVETEQGTIGVTYHIYRNGASDTDAAMTTFDFRNQGGQDRLYPFERYSVGATIGGRHRAWLTYQPFELVTNVTFKEDVTVGETYDESGSMEFEAGTPMELSYKFPFYRFSYTYDVLGKYDNAVLGLGMVLQIRNVSIQFKALDGDSSGVQELYVSNNVGLVPALAIYSEYRFPFGLVLSADIAGSYASSQFFNGADFDFEGSILDASLRIGYQVDDHWELFGNARFFGGTSNGTSQFEVDTWTESTYRYSQNDIATLAATVGVKWTN